ncbi:MAG: O-antigen ligase family protein [Planctomycetota bacterium]|nr:O-antigen ligase family protein [Planctomycetota bacterium]
MASVDVSSVGRSFPSRMHVASGFVEPSIEGGWSGTVARVPLPALLLLLALLFPTNTSFYVGTLRLTAYRLVLLVFFFPCVVALLSRQCGRVRWCDVLMIGHVLWAMLALIVVHGPVQGLQSGGIYIVEGLGTYLLARRHIRDASSFRGLVKVWTLIVVLLSLVTVPEAITGYHFMQPEAKQIGRRMGLERAYGPFDHPILLGVFCSSILGLSWYVLSSTLGRWLRLAAVIVSAAMSVSSGAVACLVTQSVGIIWDGLTRTINRRWWHLFIILALMYVAVDCYSNRTPMTIALYYLTFNADTAYGRILIWDCGTAEVQRHPFFGIGNNSWEHPTWISDSVDNFWLCTTMMYGLPAILMLGGAFAYVVVQLATRDNLDAGTAVCRMGWMVSMTGLCIAGCTVHFWNSSFVALMMLLGSSIWMLDAARPALPTAYSEST